MKTRTQRFVALLLAIVMILGIFPANALVAHAADVQFTAKVDGNPITLTVDGTEDCPEGTGQMTVVRASIPADAKTLTLHRPSQTADLSAIYADQNDSEATELENDSKTASIDLTAGYQYLCFWVTDGESEWDYHLYLDYQESEIPEGDVPEDSSEIPEDGNEDAEVPADDTEVPADSEEVPEDSTEVPEDHEDDTEIPEGNTENENEETETEPADTVDVDGIPFSASVGKVEQADDLDWMDWGGNTSAVPCYTVTVPEGTSEVTLTFPEEMQCAYYDKVGNYIANLGGDAMAASTSFAVDIQDSNKDGDLDGISVQIPDTFATSYYIAFAYAEAGGDEGGETPAQCLSIADDASATGTTTAGALYELELSKVFSDSESHNVTYSLETTVENQHTKIKEGVFCFSNNIPGDYEVKLTATCGDGKTVTHTMVITVEEAPDGIAAQYGYDETAKSSVSVYVTLSNDGYPIVAADGTVMANMKVTVPYFDLGLYGLENYYRYGTDGGKGPYTSSNVIQRPTGLHLYIYLLERYYMGLDEDKCGLGTSGVLDYAGDTEVYYMNGEKAYDSNGMRALKTSGGATSIYMVNFWGHDENLMYFRNHCYPLMSAGWGSTSDYILLSDGDAWDVGMFSNWSFNRNGRYASFDKEVYKADAGASVSVSTKSWGTTSEALDFKTMTDLNVGLYDSDWTLIEELEYTSGNTLTFKAPETAGTYYLLGVGDEICNNKADIAPAAARLVVGGGEADGPVEVSGIRLNTYKKTLIYNKDSSKTLQLNATVTPAEATGWEIVWTSSDETVATVDANGLVTALKEGKATITASIGEIKAECVITVEKYNTAPALVKNAPTYTKAKTGANVELDIASLFTDEQNDELTYSAEILKASALAGSWEYEYSAVDGFDTTVTDGKYTVSFPETGVYVIKATANDGKASASHNYQVTVVNNDSGVIKLNDGVTMDIYNVVVVDSSEEFVEDYEIPFKGTHDTTIHHIVLSKNTLSGTPLRKMTVSIEKNYGWGQYNASIGGDPTFQTRADIGVFALDAEGVQTAHFLLFHTECATHTDADKNQICDVCTMNFACETCADENGDKICDVCGKDLNNLPTLVDGVENLTVKIQTGLAYQADDLVNGKIFQDADKDSLSYSYRKSSDGGETWGDWNVFGNTLEHGTVNKALANDKAGTYTYEFKANDGRGDSEERWILTLEVLDVVPADITFYVGRDQNYNADTHPQYPVLELYKTAGIDENQYDYVGWFTNAEGKTEYVYDPQDYTILDGEKDYVVINEVQYELHDYEKVTFTNSAFDDTDETATASGTVADNYNKFYATITSGRYSTRAYGYNTETQKYDIYLGGQSLPLPMEKDIYGNGGNDLYLRVVTCYTNSKKTDGTYFTADDYHVDMIMPVMGSMIHSGDSYVSTSGMTYYPFMSYAAGNASLYNVYAYPHDTENYIFSQSINNTTSKGYTLATKSISIATAVELKVTVPETGDFGLYFQYNNFNTKEVEPIGEAVVNGNGTKTISYRVTKSNSNYTWRLTDPSGTYVTKAGWLKAMTAATEKTITFSTLTNKAYHSFSRLGTTVANRDEADIQVFLSASGFKSVSDKTRIRAYRMWEIIDSDPGNIMIEPDFNIQVLQGNKDDISLVSGGNVEHNWIDVNPTGTDIVAVNYDALDVLHTNDDYGAMAGVFPATNPERTGVFVITNETAGTADAYIPFNGSKDTDRGTKWDYNYDTWSYLNTEEAPTMDFTVVGTGDVAVSYATVITDSDLNSTLSDWTSVSADANGYYHADLLKFRNAGTKGGTIIIKMTDSTGTSYRLARAAEMTATVKNVSFPGEPFTPGDQVSITFDGLYRSINKISGIFNPLTYHLRYTVGNAEVNGALGQYQQMDKTSITLTIPEDITFPEGAKSVDYSFTNGYIYGSMYSAAMPFDSMYYITDTGVGTNFSAVGTSFVMSRLADIPITVYPKVYYDVKLNVTDEEGNALTGYTLTMADPEGNVLTPDENGVYQDLGYGDYDCDIALAGYRHNISALRINSADAEHVVDGILTKTIVLEKGAEGSWDGSSVAEPKTDDKGVYQISTGAELAWFAKTVNAGSTGISAVLTADIDLCNYDWTPIGTDKISFNGKLDGQNHKIYNLYIHSTTGATYQGLFAYTGSSAAISNLTVEGSIYSTSPNSVSQARIGGVVGSASGTAFTNVHADVDITIGRVKGSWANVGGITGLGGSFTNCSNRGDVSGYSGAGGITGSSGDGFIHCYNSGNIKGYQYVGGITGQNCYGNIVACYNTGDVTGTSTYVGGIIGQMPSGKTMNSCFNMGTVNGSSNRGALTGRLNGVSAVLTNNYYLDTSCGAGIGANGKEQHIAIAVDADTMASRDFVKSMNSGLETPAYAKGENHPILTWQDPNAEVIAPVRVSELKLDAEELNVYLGETGQLTATVNEDADNKTLTWTSSDETIATVDENGVVTAVAVGTATITVSTTDGSALTASCVVTVAEVPEWITMTADKTTVAAGEELTLTLTSKKAIADAYLWQWNIIWNSDLFEVVGMEKGDAYEGAAVNMNATTNPPAPYKASSVTSGNALALHELKAGTLCTLTLKAKTDITADTDAKFYIDYVLFENGVVDADNNITGVLREGIVTDYEWGIDYTAVPAEDADALIISVEAPDVIPVTGIALDKTELVLTEGATGKLNATVDPEVATDKTVTWTSSDETVATVDENGTVTAVKAGTAVITAKAGDQEATCTVTVEAEKTVVAAPTNVKASNDAATGKIKISWNAVEGAVKYKVYRSKTQNGTYGLMNTVTGTSMINKNAVAGQKYFYYVVAVAADGTVSEQSNTVSRTCDLAQPVITLGNDAATGKIKISWNAVEGAVKYKVYRSKTETGTYSLLNTVTGTSMINKNAVAGQKYFYKVIAVAENTDANSAASAIKSRVCDLAQPVITLSNDAATGKIKISWNAVEGAVKYKVYRSKTETGTYSLMNTVTGTSMINKNGVAGTRYYYKVVAVAENTDANSAASAIKNRVCDLARPVVKATVNKDGKPQLTWNAIDGAVSYKVYRCKTQNGTYSLMKTVTDTSYVNLNAVAGTTYFYKVVAVHSDTNANSVQSVAVSATAK